ncbi:MAG: PKD domain-containing protein [Bacteroidetes bacterium]|nr:MAG: PKD domain-containing protein [Bacteroidota bacterium]
MTLQHLHRKQLLTSPLSHPYMPYMVFNRLKFFLGIILAAVVFYLGTNTLTAQCSASITNFPYSQSFENGPAGWASDGVFNDWAWGTPNKAAINSAASGNICWITGGLTGSFYNYSQRSFVESPCFDFTSLNYPYISFKIWWESEQRFDGANFQYSVDDGSTWNNVGSVNEPENCLNENWYNYSPITHLSDLASVRDGWSGNIQPTVGNCLGGQGSNGWVTARHCLPYLANEPKVRFRFTFGAGTTCNDFDGFAFDDIRIENAPAIKANFITGCSGTGAYTFTDVSDNCPDTWHWNFGDPASGAANTSTEQNPTHLFSGPGLYTITLQAWSACSPGSSFSKTIRVYEVNASGTPVDCNGNTTGMANATVTPMDGNPVFSWNSTPAQNGPTATGLAAGTYVVTVTGDNACPVLDTVTIQEPPPIQYSVATEPAFCGNPIGSATLAVAGGTPPYQYNWSPPGGAGNTAGNLPVGSYQVVITDLDGCSTTATFNIDSVPFLVALSSSNISCSGASDGSIQLQPLNGTAPFSYIWSPDGGPGAGSDNLDANMYSITVTDANQCTATLSETISEPDALDASVEVNAVSCFGESDGSIFIGPVDGGSPPYLYAIGQTGFGTAPTFEGLPPGTYNTLVQDLNGCFWEATVAIPAPPPLVIIAGPDTSITLGNSILLSGIVSNPDQIQQSTWTPSQGLSCDTCLSTLAVPAITQVYTLEVTDINGCTASDEASIIVGPGSVYIPNAIAPNSIQLNDRFTVYGGGNIATVVLLRIFDRWGNLLFEQKDFPPSEPLSGWDGKSDGRDAPAGIYLYQIRVRYINGSTEDFSGDLLLSR